MTYPHNVNNADVHIVSFNLLATTLTCRQVEFNGFPLPLLEYLFRIIHWQMSENNYYYDLHVGSYVIQWILQRFPGFILLAICHKTEKCFG